MESLVPFSTALFFSIEDWPTAAKRAMCVEVPIAFGIDLWGPQAQRSQLREFGMTIDLDDPPHIIRSATRINAGSSCRAAILEIISAGAYADLLFVKGAQAD
jgi:hypothetical protein